MPIKRGPDDGSQDELWNSLHGFLISEGFSNPGLFTFVNFLSMRKGYSDRELEICRSKNSGIAAPIRPFLKDGIAFGIIPVKLAL